MSDNTDSTTDAATWMLGLVMLCESSGLTDPRNPGSPMRGMNGLCTVGETAAGTWGAVWSTIDGAPAASTWVKLDACDIICNNTAIVFTAEIGPYVCPVASDQAFYYKSLYAWWSYDGDGTYGSAEEDGFHGHITMNISPLSLVTEGTAAVGNVGITPGANPQPCGSPTSGPLVVADA